jgi:hypothetical protein
MPFRPSLLERTMRSVEGKLRRKIKDSIQQVFAPCVVYHIHGEGHQEAGIPDLICCIQGRFFGLEVKDDEEEEATEIQQFQIRRITKANGYATTVHNSEEAISFIKFKLQGEE